MKAPGKGVLFLAILLSISQSHATWWPDCGRNLSPTTSTTTTTTTTTTIKPQISETKRQPGEKSREKCKEYVALSTCSCDGVSDRIVGGEAAELGEFPHMALLGYYNKKKDGIEWDCGGSLISENFILTAGHCLYSKNNEPIIVRIGDLNYTDPNDDEYVQEIGIERIYEHPDYKHGVHYNDIALLKLNKTANLSECVKPICLWTKPTINFKKAIVAGWGNIAYLSKKSDLLLKTILDIFSTKSCNKTYSKDIRVLPRGIDDRLQMCAGPFSDANDTCKGDSGGPIKILSQHNKCSYYQLGVISFGKQCGNEGIPSVYTKVYPYLKWIEDIVWPQDTKKKLAYTPSAFYRLFFTY